MYTYTSLIGGCAYTRQPALAYDLVSHSGTFSYACFHLHVVPKDVGL